MRHEIQNQWGKREVPKSVHDPTIRRQLALTFVNSLANNRAGRVINGLFVNVGCDIFRTKASFVTQR